MSAKSSQRAVLLLVTEEDGDQNYYIKCEEHFSWPGGASGPTVGIGFDCGYETSASIQAEWGGFIDAPRVAVLATAAGHHGAAGQQFVAAHKNDITITWAESLAQFSGRELPRWEAIVQAHLPNTDKLSGDSFGAITSLTYNRGPSYDEPGDHYAEMRNIKAHMAAERFDLIPGEFLSMRRLWAKGGDLWNRRGHEALLFRDGLTPTPLAIAAPVQAADHSTEALQAALNRLGASPTLEVDGGYGRGTKTAVRAFQQKAGLGVDGLAGDKTWAAITAALAAPGANK